MGCARYLLSSPTYLVENAIASHPGGRPGAALIRSESSRGVLARLIFARRLLRKGSSLIVTSIVSWVERLVQEGSHQVLSVGMVCAEAVL